MTENKVIGMADRIVKLWPIIALLVGGIVGYLNMQTDVKTLKAVQEKWQAASQERREKNHEQMDSMDKRISILEAKQWCREHGGCR